MVREENVKSRDSSGVFKCLAAKVINSSNTGRAASSWMRVFHGDKNGSILRGGVKCQVGRFRAKYATVNAVNILENLNLQKCKAGSDEK